MVAGLCDRRDLKEYMSTSLQYRCTGSSSICTLLLTFPTPTLSLAALQITLSALGLLECTAYKYKGACTLQGIWTNRDGASTGDCSPSACENALQDSSEAQLPGQKVALELTFPPFPSPLFPQIKYLIQALPQVLHSGGNPD